MLSLDQALLAAAAVDCKAKDKPISFFFGWKTKAKENSNQLEGGIHLFFLGWKMSFEGGLGQRKMTDQQ